GECPRGLPLLWNAVPADARRTQMNQHDAFIGGDYVLIKALEDGVSIIGLTRGKDTRFHHTERLDAGEVMLAQFTEHTSAIKIRGRARIVCRFGEIESGTGRSTPER